MTDIPVEVKDVTEPQPTRKPKCECPAPLQTALSVLAFLVLTYSRSPSTLRCRYKDQPTGATSIQASVRARVGALRPSSALYFFLWPHHHVVSTFVCTA